MKKILTLLGISLLMFGFISCSDGDDSSSPFSDASQKTETDDNSENNGDSGNDNSVNEEDVGEDTSTALASGVKIYVVGDSTVCEYFDENGKPTDNYYLPRYGWGTQIHKYLNVSENQVVNLALSGRSSKSFLVEDNYTTLTSSIKSGDYLIIGFGHNDEKSGEDARFTDPAGTKDTEETEKGTSLKWNFYEKYIKMAKDKGATPILCTPICRYDSSNTYSNNSYVHVTSDGDYPKAIIDLGAETDTTVIDLTKLTSDVYKADNDAARFFHAHTTYKGDPKAPPYNGTEEPDGLDGTHINMFGAKMVSYQFAQALKNTTCTLKNCVKTNTTSPTKANDYFASINNAYIKPNYQAPDVSTLTKLATTTKDSTSVDWYKSAFGVLGGATKVSDYTITYTNSKFKIAADTGSKFASDGDGMGAAFVQLPKNTQFKATAKMKVTAAASTLNNQVGCGMMLRDDMLIDTQDSTLASNFVAAALSGDGKAIFSRSDKVLTRESNSMDFKVSNTVEYTVSIEFLGQTTTVSVSNGTTTCENSPYQDFDYVARDNDYIYLCLFANRGLTVEFSDVEVEIKGEFGGA